MKFFDTCAALILQEQIFDTNEEIYISEITLCELEKIKTSKDKDDSIKYSARRLIRLLFNNKDKYNVIKFDKYAFLDFEEYFHIDFYISSPDLKIISCAYNTQVNGNRPTFITSDIYCAMIAQSCGLKTEYVDTKRKTSYTGFIDVKFDTDDKLNEFYEDILCCGKNPLNLLVNQYAIIRNSNNEIIDKFRYTGEYYARVEYTQVDSEQFGLVKPRNIHQLLALDSFRHNDVTLIGGPAGSGKTLLSFGYLFELLERNKIDRIVIFCNPVVAKNAAKLGYYPGTQLEKILSSQVGNVLASKLGSMIEVERLVNEQKLVIIPAGDCRGYEVPKNSGVYIMEAQNLDTTLLRMLLQRVGDDCKVIVDGDREEQTDLDIYANDNGMEKMSEVYRGEDIFGQVDLQSIERCRIGKIAERMK